ncbi:helix-turn-helix domain-containing protein [Paractinoplanes globisporus]|uniref:Helix-turn-helix domain-containing protein n=1 Tax=Paractinoplanes globisporus TaxID=113565 RepID=A0ABW6W8C5_9ACTN|nr:helix-turn-helix domain-containing protein [Actinoplanes globisporus]
MPRAGETVDWASVEIAVPRPSCRLPGVSMAGFAYRDTAPIDVAMVAHPAVTLLLDLGGDALVHDSGGRRERGNVVIGLHPGDLRVSGAGPGRCLQIRLDPVAATAVLGGSPELSGTMVTLDALWGRDASRVGDRLHAAGSWDKTFTIAYGMIARRLAASRPVDPEVARTWRRMRATRGRVRVEHLAGEVGWSRQRLWSRFGAQVGLTPKRAARLIRFDHAAHLLAAGHAPAEVATETGCADQSHLNREVREFSGLTSAAVATAPWLAIDDIAWPAG